MNRYLIVIYWRQFNWTLRAHAKLPATLKGIASHFGSEHPISIQVMAKP